VTVLYCLADIDPAAALPSGGLPGADGPRALRLAGGLAAIVATLPDTEYAPEIVNARLRDMDWVSKAALGHEQLVEAVMRSSPCVLPMKLLTLFSGDARLLEDLGSRRREIARAAARVRGCDEYGLRIVARDGAPPPKASERPVSGTAFLERKKQARDESRDQAARRAAFAREAFDSLARVSRDAVSRPVQQDDLERPLLDAAFLVARDEQAAFGRAAEALGARAGGEFCVYKLTGPWPPYHFVQMSHAS
jgi:hypothetical protein